MGKAGKAQPGSIDPSPAAAPHQLPGRELGSRWRGAGGEGSAESLTGSTMIMTPWEDLFFVINNLLLGEEPSIEDFILLVGTSVAFIAFILWCCFPIEPKDSLGGSEHLTTQAADAVYDAKYMQLATSPACRKPGLQDLMQYDINT